MPVDWSLGRMPDVGNNALRAFQVGAQVGQQARKAQDERELRKAVAAAASNPDDPKALQTVMALDPELGMKLEDRQQTRSFNSAMGDYLGGGGLNALAMPLARQPQPSAAPGQGINALAMFSQPQGHWPSPDQVPSSAAPQSPQLPDSRQEEPDPDFAVLGEPQNGKDRAFLRMLKIDPMKAIKLQTTLRDNFVKLLKDSQTVYSIGIDRLSNATDEASYQAVLAELAPLSEAIGGDLLEHVPPNYPGPDGIRELTMKALDAKDRVAAFMRQADIEADNQRADRNTDSLIADRNARRDETRRYHDVQAGNTRRGQDVRSRDTRRGQDRRGRGGRGATQARPTATNTKTGEKMEWDGQAWVTVQ